MDDNKTIDEAAQAIDDHQSMIESTTDRHISLTFVRPIDTNTMTIAEME